MESAITRSPSSRWRAAGPPRPPHGGGARPACPSLRRPRTPPHAGRRGDAASCCLSTSAEWYISLCTSTISGRAGRGSRPDRSSDRPRCRPDGAWAAHRRGGGPSRSAPRARSPAGRSRRLARPAARGARPRRCDPSRRAIGERATQGRSRGEPPSPQVVEHARRPLPVDRATELEHDDLGADDRDPVQSGDVLLAETHDAVNGRQAGPPTGASIATRHVNGHEPPTGDSPQRRPGRATGEGRSATRRARRSGPAARGVIGAPGCAEDATGHAFEPARTDEVASRLAVEPEMVEVLDEDEAVLSPADLVDGVEDGHRRIVPTGCDNVRMTDFSTAVSGVLTPETAVEIAGWVRAGRVRVRSRRGPGGPRTRRPRRPGRSSCGR